MREPQIRFLFGDLPPGADLGDPKVRAELLARDQDLNSRDLALRQEIARQIDQDNPPEVWETAERLLGLDYTPGQAIAQLAFALAHATRAAMAEDQELDLGEFVASLRWLPLPGEEALATLLVDLVRAEPGIAVDDLSREVLAALGREPDDALALDVFDRINEELVDAGGPLAWLADDRTVHIADLLSGCVLTHRLSNAETLDGVLDSFDLVGLDRLPRLHLAGGEPIEPAFDDEANLGWSGPEGWLAQFRPGNVLSLRVAADATVSLEETAEPPEDAELVGRLRRIYDHAVEESHLPASLEEIALSLLLEDRDVFAQPRLPLGELCKAAGLELRGNEVAHDPSLWANARQLGVLGRVMDHFEDDEDRTAAMRALDAAMDSTVAPHVLREVMDGLLDDDVIQFVAEQLLGPDEDPVALEQTRAFGERLLRAARRPTEVAVASWVAAVAAERDGRALDAESYLKRAVEAEPSWGPGLDRAGRCAFDRGNAAEAVALWQRMEEPPKLDLELAKEFAAGTQEHRLDRNDPCWCGSGRKYKVCHLGRPELAPLPDRIRWFYRKAVAYLERRGPGALADLLLYAAARALDGSDEAITEALEDPIVTDATLTEGGWFERFLDERGPLLPDDEALLGAAWILVARTVYEIVELSPGVGIVLRDLRTGDRIEVRGQRLSQDARLGLLVCGRAVPDGHTHRFIGAVFAVAPGTETSVLELCEAEDPELLCLYVADLSSPPRLATREDEPLVACTAVVDTGQAQDARAWLDSRYEDQGDDWVEFHEIEDGERVVRARLVLHEDRLSVFTSSEQRLDRVLGAIRAAFPAATVLSDEREPIGPHNMGALAGPGIRPDATLIPPPAEIADAMRELQETYEARWVDERIPALGGLTPRQAAADPTRHEELQRLIGSFPDPSGLPEGSFVLRPARLRELLGLVPVGGSAGDAH